MPIELNNRFLLLYGSQTGQAQAIAEEIVEKAAAQNLHADIHCLGTTEKKFFIEREKCVVIVTSTTGDGEPPDTALKFFRRLRKKTLPNDYLSHLNYGLLGLGDSNYTNFCNCGKNLDKRLQDLGAHRFYDAGWADDAIGLEVVVEPWIDGLWDALRTFLNIPPPTVCFNQCEIISPPSDNHTPSSEGIMDAASSGNVSLSCDISPGVNGHSQPSTDICRTESDQTNVNQSNANVTITNNNQSGSNVAESSAVISSRTSCFSEQDKNSDTNSSSILVKEPISSNNSRPSSIPDEHLVAVIKKDPKEEAALSEIHSNKSDDTTVKVINENDHDNCGDSSVNGGAECVFVASVRVSLPPLSESSLTVPMLPPRYLKIEYHPEETVSEAGLPLQNDCAFPSAASPVVMATVVSMETLTTSTAVKKAMSVKLDISGSGVKYDPGDSFSVICPNDAVEVDMILNRLCVLEQSNIPYRLTVLADTKKKNASVPKHVPEVGYLKHVFTTCLDIREPPKKALLRVLIEYTSNQSEKRRLQELCSKQGASDYTQFIREPGLSILDILKQFPSCTPPVETLIEHLPRLQPRPYSACTSSLTVPEQVGFVFNVIEIGPAEGRLYQRKGVCTGWMEALSLSRIQTYDDHLTEAMGKLDISGELKIPMFARTNQNFHLPDDVTIPLILIGPGTGVAPFMGFLDHRAAQRQFQPDTKFGEVWLFYGCRHRDRDFLFREQMEHHVATSAITKLLVSFSRDDQILDSPRYVQDNLRSHGRDVVRMLEEDRAMVYICGDAKNMAKDVNEAFMDVISQEKGISEDEAKKLMMKLRLEKRYKEDVWT